MVWRLGYRLRQLGRSRHLIQWLGLGISFCLIVLCNATVLPLLGDVPAVIAQPDPIEAILPSPAVHPLPITLARWGDRSEAGDYFDQVHPSKLGYLIWSHFPITLYIQPPQLEELAIPFQAKRAQAWVTAVNQAAKEWNQYLPLEIVSQSDTADIQFLRITPPLRLTSTPSSAGDRPATVTTRARTAETRFEIVFSKPAQPEPEKPALLSHRMVISLRPDQAPDYLLAAARHELGHALGIWGHSLSEADALYFSQVRTPPIISVRDVNTLKRVYEQATRLGWPLQTSNQ